jgi:hypothetical protein
VTSPDLDHHHAREKSSKVQEVIETARSRQSNEKLQEMKELVTGHKDTFVQIARPRNGLIEYIMA